MSRVVSALLWVGITLCLFMLVECVLYPRGFINWAAITPYRKSIFEMLWQDIDAVHVMHWRDQAAKVLVVAAVGLVVWAGWKWITKKSK